MAINKSGSVSKRTQFATDSQTIWYGKALPQRPVQLVLDKSFRIPGVCPRQLLRNQWALRLSMPTLSSPDVADEWHHLRVHEIAADDLVLADYFLIQTKNGVPALELKRQLGIGYQEVY